MATLTLWRIRGERGQASWPADPPAARQDARPLPVPASGEFYLAASDLAGTAPGSCLFVDDTELNVAGARAAGLRAHRWTGPADIPYLRQILVG